MLRHSGETLLLLGISLTTHGHKREIDPRQHEQARRCACFVKTLRGPATSAINSVAKFADTMGTTLEDSAVFVDNKGNIQIEGITKKGITLNWPSTSGGAGNFLGTDGEGNLFFDTPSGGGNVSSNATFLVSNKIITTDVVNGARNIKRSDVALDNNNNITGVNSLAASMITADLIGNVTGAASQNVLKDGDSMNGPLVLLTQAEVIFQDATSGESVGLQAPETVNSSYTLTLPSDPPTTGQILCANNTTPTALEWLTDGSTISPLVSNVIQVASYGDDTTGNGSLTMPYATLSKAVETANALASATNPVVIYLLPGIYTEDNSSGPLTITAGGISITGDSSDAVIIRPASLSADLLAATTTICCMNITLQANGVSTAVGLTLSGTGNSSQITNVYVQEFATGILCSGTATTNIYRITACSFLSNTIGLSINNNPVTCTNCVLQGTPPTAVGTGVAITGSSAQVIMNGGNFSYLAKACTLANNAQLTANEVVSHHNSQTLEQSSGADSLLQSCSCKSFDTAATVIDLQISGSGTTTMMNDCLFDGSGLTGATNATALSVTGAATCTLVGGSITGYTKGIAIGASLDTSSTALNAASLVLRNCTQDIVQSGLATLTLNDASASSTKIALNNSTNVSLAYFDYATDKNLVMTGLTASKVVVTNASNKLTSSSTSSTDLSYLTGVTSSIQTQIDGKVAKAGDIMTGALQVPAGTAASPTLKFTGSTNTGISAATANKLSFDTNGTERMSISTSDVTMASKLILSQLLCLQAVQVVTATSGGSVSANATTSVLILKPSGLVLSYTVVFPPSPTDGQLFVIMVGNSTSIPLTNDGNGASIVNPVTSINPTVLALGSALTSATYIYSSADNTWYRWIKG